MQNLEERGFTNQRITPQNMSSSTRMERRAAARLHTPNSHQEWVPRGPIGAPPSDQPPRYSRHSAVDGGNSNGTASNVQHRRKSPNRQRSNGVVDRVPVHRSNDHGPRGGYKCRYVSNRKDRDKEKSEVDERKMVKDPNLPQLVQELQEKLTKGTVECMICYDMVRRTAPIWACSSCYSIFHLNCIKKWAKAPTSVDLSADTHKGTNWRCPGCQHVQLTLSKDIRYLCFCGKRTDPSSDLYLTPHSCGEHCGKPLERDVRGGKEEEDYLCPHVCVLQCHPGPCPPCKAFAPPRLCPCGKKTITTRCSDRKPVLTCGQRCDKLLGCGRHMCENLCHVGPCEPCGVVFDASCFCKKNAEVVICGEMTVKGEVDMKDGVFSCGSTCGKKLGCNNHGCGEICHPGPCEECSLLPRKIKTCHCGKTALAEKRRSCLDPVPVCSQVCGKSLSCRIHQCKETCHEGECPPCHVSVTQKCRCGLTSRTTECYRTREEEFNCEKPCGRKKNCGRHRCSERCCPSSNKIGTPSLNGELDPHFCKMPCEKKLRCGQHSCERLCHSGHCPPCLETIFTDLTCACGGTSIPPPLPCGTPPPSCQLPCSVPQPCGHQSTHSCHLGECPPCSVPIAKECVGGHVVLRNIPCGSKDIRCNKLCGKTRCCGLHACARTCHGPPCDANPNQYGRSSHRSSCGQVCGAPRRDCRHTCKAPCHPSAACPDVRCDYPVTISCSCGRITASVPCGSGGASTGFSLEASIVQQLPAPLQPLDSGNGNRVPLGQRKLVCDGECAKVERKRVLADAFDITTPNLDSLHLGENPASSELVADLMRRDPKWVLSVEERCKFLVLGKSRVNSSSLKVHVFCPMLQEKREAVSLIAARWKLGVNTAGWEPKRFVVVHATSKSKPPSRVLGVKGSLTAGTHPPLYDPLVDMDSRLVVSFLDLPREADISALVLRFGGECELVWVNDKNALAVFGDPTRAATALRRLDHGSVYHGATVVVQDAGGRSCNNAWGGGAASVAASAAAAAPVSKGGNPWKKAVAGEEDLWALDWSTNTPSSPSETPSSGTGNRWTILDGGATSHSSAAEAGSSNEVAEDWEKAYE